MTFCTQVTTVVGELMAHMTDLIFFVSIVLMAINIVLIYGVVYVIGKQFSFFYPWRVLLLGSMLYSLFLFCSDVWWFLAEIPVTSRFHAQRLLMGRLLFSGVIWAFSWAWWRSLRQGGRTNGRGSGVAGS